MSDISTVEWIIIGFAGGSGAGITVWLLDILHKRFKDWQDKKRVYDWLYKVTKSEKVIEKWRYSRAIASYNNLTEDRAKYICSIHKKICLSTGPNPDMYGIIELTRNAKDSTIP